MPIFAQNIPLKSLIFLKKSKVFPILLFSSIPFNWSLRKAFFSLLSMLFCGTLHSNDIPHLFSFAFHIFFFFSAICKASSDSHFAFLHVFFLGKCQGTFSFKGSNVLFSSFVCCFSRTLYFLSVPGKSRAARSSQDWETAWIHFSDSSLQWPFT